MNLRHAIVASTLAGTSLALIALAQTQPPAQIKFEVASIRPAAKTPGATSTPQPAGGGGPGFAPPPPPPPGMVEYGCLPRMTTDAARVERGCVTLLDVLTMDIFLLPRDRLAGPDWMGGQRFDISAKLPAGATENQLPEMFRALLEDRFGLRFHRENKEQAVYALVVSKTGLKINPVAAHSKPPDWVSGLNWSGPTNRGMINGIPFRSLTHPPPSNGAPLVITMQTANMGVVRNTNTTGENSARRYEAPSISSQGIADLAVVAGAGPNVIDATGLKGRYSVDFSLSMSELMELIRSQGPPDPNSMQRAQLTMLQEAYKKLGLELQARKAPVETIVIDHLDRMPTAN